VRCLLCGKTVPLFRLLRERKFCTNAHQEQYHKQLMACLTEDPPVAVPEGKKAPAPAGLIAPIVPPHSATEQPLPGVGWAFSFDAIREPASGSITASHVPPPAALLAIPTTPLNGRQDPAPPTLTPRSSRALPLRMARGGASVCCQGLLPATAVPLNPAVAAKVAKPAKAASVCLLADVKALFESAAGHRQSIDPPDSFRDTPRTAGLIAFSASLVVAPGIPVPSTTLVRGTAPMLPRLQLVPRAKAWYHAGALSVGLPKAADTLPALAPFTAQAAARAFPERAFNLPARPAAPCVSRAPILLGLRACKPGCDPGEATEHPVAPLDTRSWALASTPSFSALRPPPILARAARPRLARPHSAVVPPAISTAQPRLALDNCWRVQMVIWRPYWEAWKSPIPLQPRAVEIPEQPLAPTPKPNFWATVAPPRWRLMMTPARAAILAVPLIGFAIALSALTKSDVPPPREEHPTVFETVRSYLHERSALLLEDDFLSGLSGWAGGPDWAAGWAYGAAGFVQPRKLALLRASLPLADYRVEFLGQIQQKSLSWVFRARDLNNYYAMKITIARPGPIPLGAIIRYTVVDGVAVDRVQLPLPLGIRNDTLYRVETSAQQDRFVTSIDGQVVDTFFDRHHPSGGVGLFSGSDEASRVLWVRVVERDDFLGRLCAYFASEPADHKTAFLPASAKKKAVTEQ
jgi:hypothetical protein